MSSLDHYVLIADWLEKIDELGEVTSIKAINVLLAEAEEDPFEEVGAITGIGSIFTLTGNYLAPVVVKEVIEAVPWFSPATVQLFHRSEHDERLTEVPLNITMCVARDLIYIEDDAGEWEAATRQGIRPYRGKVIDETNPS